MATATAVLHSFSAFVVIRGYHVYQRIWTPHAGEKATTVREPGNDQDQSASNVVINTQRNNVQFLPGTATLHTNIYHITS